MGFQGRIGGAAFNGLYTGGGVQHFDSGLHLPQRTAIRQAIVDRLAASQTGNGRPLLRSGGGYVTKIGVLPRPLKGDSDDELALVWIALQGATPALCVALGRMELSPVTGNEEYLGELELAIYSLSRNLRSFVEGRLAPDGVAAADPTADPGVETMMEHVRELLCGQELELLGVHEVRPKTEDEVTTDGEGTLWEQRFSVVVEVSVNPQRANSDLVRELDAQHVTGGADDSDRLSLNLLTTLEVP